jgi:hypothetical protein
MDELLVRLGVGSSPALGAGRAGQRLGQLASLTRFFEEAATREDAALAAAQ